MPTTILIFIAVTVVNVCWWLFRERARRREIVPAHLLQRKHGLYAENRPVIRLDPARVPDHLRDLIPLAEKWGIGDDIIRFDFEEKSSASERDELVRAVAPRLAEIEAWLHTANPSAMSDEAAAFMYLAEAYAEVDAARR
jgi:acetyl-CoA acetyltransferase